MIFVNKNEGFVVKEIFKQSSKDSKGDTENTEETEKKDIFKDDVYDYAITCTN